MTDDTGKPPVVVFIPHLATGGLGTWYSRSELDEYYRGDKPKLTTYIDADVVRSLVEAGEKWLKVYDAPRRGSDFANGAHRMRTALAKVKKVTP